MLNDLLKLTYSSYICELIDICAEEEKNNYLYREFLTCLYLMNTNAIDYEILIRAFELKLLKATGYDINFNSCAICKKKITTSNYISLSNFGGVCESCNKEHGIYISKASYNALRFLKETPMDKVYRLNASKDMKDEMSNITSFIISSNYVKKPKSLEMLKFIKE